MIEIVNLVVNGLAMIIAISSLIVSIRTFNKQKKVQLRENYYEPVFKDIMTQEFPFIFTSFVNIDKEQIYPENSTPFENCIHEFRKKIKYMMFTNPVIYSKIDNLLIKIDELIVVLCTKEENKDKNINEIFKLSKNLYEEIENYFINP